MLDLKLPGLELQVGKCKKQPVSAYDQYNVNDCSPDGGGDTSASELVIIIL